MFVSDSSPLINLARIGELTLLRDLYGEIHIPKAVWREVVEKGEGQAGADEIKAATWIKSYTEGARGSGRVAMICLIG